jgi:hypothetical protein
MLPFKADLNLAGAPLFLKGLSHDDSKSVKSKIGKLAQKVPLSAVRTLFISIQHINV